MLKCMNKDKARTLFFGVLNDILQNLNATNTPTTAVYGVLSEN